ncbi:MAG TPA: hypothetical protein VKQ27_04280 [Acetobacteraceae bacterium]|nr:hypothetical protein [Acetobacteraceae bacterium]
MQSTRSIFRWMVSGFCVALILSVAVLGLEGIGEKATVAALRVTGRWSFLLFWLAYTGSAMATLLGQSFQPIRRRSREFGLAFASAHLVHLALVAWLCWIGATPATSVFVLFGIAVFWTYAIALVSFGDPRKMLGSAGWWLLRAVGLNYIAYAFATDFTSNPFSGGITRQIAYVPFAILSVLGPILWVAGEAARFARGRAATAIPAGRPRVP